MTGAIFYALLYINSFFIINKKTANLFKAFKLDQKNLKFFYTFKYLTKI